MFRRLPLAAALLLATPLAAQQDRLLGFDLDSFGKTVLSRKQFGSDVIPEAAYGAYNNEFISAYSSQSVFARIGRSVGRLDVATDKGVFPCTAFLVDDDILMTNHHCVPGILDDSRTEAKSIVGVRFVMGYTQEGVTEGTSTFLVDPVPVETSKPLDYTLLRILGDTPGRDFGTLELAAVTPHDNDPYWIIGHPMGEAQRISREKCRANAPALSDSKLLHTCDTMPGNSGSPVIDAGTRQVVGLHHAGSANNSVNYAIPMAAILAASNLLKPATGGEGPDDAEGRALTRLSDALLIDNDGDRRIALETLVAEAPATSAARTASRLLAALQPAPPPPPTLAERMAASADVQDCDRLAGDRFHPDRAAGLMRSDGTVFEAMDAEAAIAACKRALDSFPDHPRMTAFLGEALSAAERYDEAFAAYNTSARAGDAIGQAGLGVAYLWGLGTERDAAKARDMFEKSAARGHPIAKTGLGVIYQHGQGVPADPERALTLYREGAEAGYHGAQDQMGDLYLAGTIVEQSDKTAAFWFAKAADQGNAAAQFNLALLYENGRGVDKSTTTAARWYAAAAEQDHAEAQQALGTLYLNGTGVPASDTKAAEWYRKAAAQGNALSLAGLAWITEQGRGVSADPAEAARLYVEALLAGNDWPATRDTAEWPRETARALQEALARAGVYQGATDGRIGPRTREAMRSLLP
ncbi:trypsin-like peptidase domain-containing protein [uncultured Mameliella sp.]|uniref:trypsin-like peptidase domain-containing protein n=1 Tax=uncultured Mameliella sp. TaxID=1447087 RepID=UPI0026225289|nr:trypsin-like peptidase domain-containing protein [uncultured Mameliella sp.]